ncbi:MAG: fructose PTS transporter subunit IIA [Candidatus Omnitrophica bacterium]|nr:fructose PTS transporter subunit IIA [Candidatus Omnitrophota bacterium]MCF7887642.1 fructose PTS transporter subunit IIA [Candidatus Omnitrophota bacterium]MCF7894981.1 fructose PTS transporter subunit IIA [Candidatus Omnitrophota bacterium]
MKIANYFNKDNILLNLEASGKSDAIKKLALLLVGSKKIIDFDQFLQDVFDREQLKTTGIGDQIAIPHARSDAVEDFVIAFGRIPQGMDFDSLDNKPAKLIFLMGTPANKGINNYLQILAYLTRILNKEDFRKDLLAAKSTGEIIEVFKKIEE